MGIEIHETTDRQKETGRDIWLIIPRSLFYCQIMLIYTFLKYLICKHFKQDRT